MPTKSLRKTLTEVISFRTITDSIMGGQRQSTGKSRKQNTKEISKPSDELIEIGMAMQDTDMAILNERIAKFVVEFHQGVDPDWLIKKYDFIGLMEATEIGIKATNPEGSHIIEKMLHADPRDIVAAKMDQQKHPNRFPWNANPYNKVPHNT